MRRLPLSFLETELSILLGLIWSLLVICTSQVLYTNQDLDVEYHAYSGCRIGWKNTLAFSGYTDNFKIHRKNIASVAGSNTSLKLFDRAQEEESVHFLLNVLDSPENLFDHIKKEAGAVILKITYGYTAEAKGKDHLVDMAGQAMHEFSEATTAGKWPVDIMPFCEFIYIAESYLVADLFSEISSR